MTPSVARAASLRPRYLDDFWNTTPSPSTIYIPPPTPLYTYSNTQQSPPDPTSVPQNGGELSSPATVLSSTFPTTTPISSSETSTITPSSSAMSGLTFSSTPPAASNTGTPFNQNGLDLHAICIGNGIDASSEGILASLVLPTVVGLGLWVLFALIRPRFRQVYALREWFVQQDLRPRPLGSSVLAFLFPPLPLVPRIPRDVSNAGRSAVTDAELFPSDEQLGQRALWTGFLVALVWSVIGLVGALPLYMVATPCLARFASSPPFKGTYSTLEDLSLLRLLRLLDAESLSTSKLLQVRAESIDGNANNARVRVIILTALTVGFSVLPALWIVLRELKTMIAHQKNFTEVRCEGKEMGWLSATQAPGFVGWGEKRLKDFILKQGLSLSMELREERDDSVRSRSGQTARRTEEQQPLYVAEEASLEVDVQSLFSIGDTQTLAILIEERDEILENLEIAETRYIGSFRVTTPDPSITDFEPPAPADTDRPYISRPLPLGQNGTRRSTGRRRRANPAFAASSLAPTSFVAPSQYYKLRSVQGVSGGRFTDSGFDRRASFTETISSRVIGNGSRHGDSNSISAIYGRLPFMNHAAATTEKAPQPDHSSRDESWRYSAIPDPRRFGPNFAIEEVDETGIASVDEQGEKDDLGGEQWVDLSISLDGGSEPNGSSPGPSASGRRPKKEPVPASRRETFPIRRDRDVVAKILPPPHLRLQPAQPFVRPLDGINFEDLGDVYASITEWRSKLKIINVEIAEAQRQCYNDIAAGARIKGWLMVGRGLRYIPGIQLIEGRAKEDIRWDVLQNERSPLDSAVLLTVIVVVTVLLAVGLTAVSGLALATAPDIADFLPFFQPLLREHPLTTGTATVFAPAVATILFTSIALFLICWVADLHGSISISRGQRFIFKVTFFMTFVAALWLVLVGALLFAMPAFSNDMGISKSMANGSIYISILALSIIVNLAIVFPALLLLQPSRLWHVLREERHAITPRQLFRAVYPRTYNPSLATGACILAIAFASLFALILPLIGPAVAAFLMLTLLAHRFLVGYVFGRTQSQTGGLLPIWLLKRLGTLVSLQPILLGLIFLTRYFWIEGGILVGTGIAVILSVEVYVAAKMGNPRRTSLSPIVQNGLNTLEVAAWNTNLRNVDDESTSHGSSGAQGPRVRGSMASVLEMMSVTLAVMPSTPIYRGPVPLKTETLDDLTATERAARTHPDAPPHLPPLPFTDHAEEMAGILYAPELIAPPPIIWLPNDSAGVARSEAVDLQRYHDLQVTLDVRAKEDVLPRRSSSSRRRRSQ